MSATTVKAPEERQIPVHRPAPGKWSRAAWVRRGPLLPALVITILITQIPFVLTIWYSFQHRNLLRPDLNAFAGLDNYTTIVTDPVFRTAVVNTIVMTTGAVLLSLLVGLGLAVVLDKEFFGRGVVRTLLITPFLVMPVAAALLWKTSFFNPVFGLVNWFLSPFGVGNLDWASVHPMLTIIIVLTWEWTPFMMLILLAGLQSQSPEILEAARVDGANGVQTFVYVTLPHMRQFIELSVLLGTIYIVQTFDAVYLITQGGPGHATTNLPFFIYQQAFVAFNVGQAAAAGVIVVVATIIISTYVLRKVSTVFRMGE
jgi:sorbitol/mannitol transport system permease protein